MQAAPSFKTYDIAVPLTKQAAVVEATNKFMSTDIGKSYQGSLHLNSYLANGMSPATHSFVLLMDSLADIAAWEDGLVLQSRHNGVLGVFGGKLNTSVGVHGQSGENLGQHFER